MEGTKNVEFSAKSFKLFKKAYAAAVESKKNAFVFEGNEYVTSYAKYVIEYLEPQIRKEMKNRLIIKHYPTEVKIQDFETWFVSTTVSVFNELKVSQFAPMACMLTSTGMLTILPDFTDDKSKAESMQQIRILARLVGCRAYAFVSEVYMKEFPIKERESAELLIDAVDGKTSMLPGNKEVLFCSIEIKNGPKTHITWDIIDRKLGPRKRIEIADEVSVSGKVSNILS